MKKKVLIFCNTYWNIYNFRTHLIRELNLNDFELHSLAKKDNYTENLGDCFTHFIKIDAHGINIFREIRTIINVISKIKEINPDIILSYTTKPNLYSAVAIKFISKKINFYPNISGLGSSFLSNNILSHFIFILFRTFLKGAKLVFFQNQFDEQIFTEKKIIKKAKTFILPGSGVDIKKFKTDRIENKGLNIVFIGRIIRDKGILEFIKAAKVCLNLNPNLNFHIYGSFSNNPSAISELQLKSEMNEANIKYFGHINNIKSALEKTDIFVLPSYREGLSRAILEACAMNLPIVTGKIPGCQELLHENKNGFYCEINNHNSLANIIMKLVDLPESKRLEFGCYSRELVVKNFSIDNVNNKIIEILKESN